MAIYSLGQRTVTVSSASAGWEARSAATDLPRVMELGVFLAAATATTLGLGRPAAIGITPTAPVTVLAEDPNDPAGTVQIAIAWSTPPTVPGAFFRRIALPATIGTGIFWTFPRGLKIPVSGISSIILWNLAANGVQDVHIVIDE